MPQENAFAIVSQTIRQRRTYKVLGDIGSPVGLAKELCLENDATVDRSIETAGFAPFHYARNLDNVAEPWRCHVLRHEACRNVARHMNSWFDDIKPNNKLPSMLAACGALVLVNWLPQFDADATTEKQQQVNEEHLAATSAMVQNLLLLLTAAGLGTYWSSGGLFRTETMFNKLGISSSERLLAAVFVDYQSPPTTSETTPERIPGKQNSKRSSIESWCRTVEIT